MKKMSFLIMLVCILSSLQSQAMLTIWGGPANVDLLPSGFSRITCQGVIVARCINRYEGGYMELFTSNGVLSGWPMTEPELDDEGFLIGSFEILLSDD